MDLDQTTLEEALHAVRQKDFANAADLFHRLEDSPLKSQMLGHRAYMFRLNGDYAAAAADYKELVKLSPGDYEARLLWGECLHLDGRSGEAIPVAAEVIAKDPFNYGAATLLLSAQRAVGLNNGETYRAAESLLSPWTPVNPVIEQFESNASHFPTSVQPEIGRLLYSMVRCLRPRIIVETGCYYGYSSLCIAQALKDNGSGFLHSFDLFLEAPDRCSPLNLEFSNTYDMVNSHLAMAGLSDYVSFHKGDSSMRIRESLHNSGQQVDFAFIDGDHSLEGCLNDWFAIDPVLSDGAIALLHDTNAPFCKWSGPAYLLEELRKRSAADYQVLKLPTMDQVGLGLIQKNGKGVTPLWKPSLINLLRDRLFIYKHWKQDKTREQQEEFPEQFFT